MVRQRDGVRRRRSAMGQLADEATRPFRDSMCVCECVCVLCDFVRKPDDGAGVVLKPKGCAWRRLERCEISKNVLLRDETHT